MTIEVGELSVNGLQSTEDRSANRAPAISPPSLYLLLLLF